MRSALTLNKCMKPDELNQVRSLQDDARESRLAAMRSIITPSVRFLNRWKRWPMSGPAHGALASRSHQDRGETYTGEVRYFISIALPELASLRSVFAAIGASRMHWILDVVFHEDASRIRTGNAVANMSFARRFVTTLLNLDTYKRSLKGKHKRLHVTPASRKRSVFSLSSV